MKILVLSDSHSILGFMQDCVEATQPDVIIHLGDYVSDGQFIAEQYPGIRFYQVAGNCDRYRVSSDFPEVMLLDFSGVRIFFTHGHLHGVKLYPDKLILDGRMRGADVVLYGHTHEADCSQMDDGMWVLNPGSAGNYGGTAGIINIDDSGKIQCQILKQHDLREAK